MIIFLNTEMMYLQAHLKAAQAEALPKLLKSLQITLDC